jgi:hypothetical protein
MSLGLPEVAPVPEPGPSISTSVEQDLTPQPAREDTPARIAGEKA